MHGFGGNAFALLRLLDGEPDFDLAMQIWP